MSIISILQKHAHDFHRVVNWDEQDSIAPIDLSASNKNFSEQVYNNAEKFNAYIEAQRKLHHARFLTGGYREHREMYRRSQLFDKNVLHPGVANNEPRSIHLGVDIWGEAGTTVYAPLGGMIHSFAFNNNFGDYGVTIILQHQLETLNFFTLYGHLSLKDLDDKRKGQFITRGEPFAHFGAWEENGNWPPHLHFQLILDMENYEGDYPGVCKLSEAGKYLHNCPDPEFILKMKP
ncbi:MAG: peptidoglycan DD-metalloendopeptidase family protein [Bacteroidetes bacterium]|nr:peptidoglycan DD-metalloendopeptidase family protein [Bacteroidota bacterium]